MNIQTEHNAGYYIAELDLPEDAHRDIWGGTWYSDVNIWCEQTYGVSDVFGSDPINGWKRMRNKYFFTEEKNLEWFVLRWS